MFDQYAQATGADPDEMQVSPLQTIALACCCFTLLLFLLTAFLSMVAVNADDVIGGQQVLDLICFRVALTKHYISSGMELVHYILALAYSGLFSCVHRLRWLELGKGQT
jgi:hypothetical protein